MSNIRALEKWREREMENQKECEREQRKETTNSLSSAVKLWICVKVNVKMKS